MLKPKPAEVNLTVNSSIVPVQTEPWKDQKFHDISLNRELSFEPRASISPSGPPEGPPRHNRTLKFKPTQDN